MPRASLPRSTYKGDAWSEADWGHCWAIADLYMKKYRTAGPMSSAICEQCNPRSLCRRCNSRSFRCSRMGPALEAWGASRKYVRNSPIASCGLPCITKPTPRTWCADGIRVLE